MQFLTLDLINSGTISVKTLPENQITKSYNEQAERY